MSVTLRSRLLIALCAVLATYALLDFLIQRGVVYGSFVALERGESVKDLERCRDAVMRQSERLSSLAQDWAAWKDVQEIVRRGDAKLPCERFTLASIEAANLTMAVLIDDSARFIHGLGRDADTGKAVLPVDFSAQRIYAGHPLVTRAAAASEVSGLLSTEKGPMIVASRAIPGPEPSGPPLGTIIVGRLLTNDRIRALAAQTRADFNIWPITPLSPLSGEARDGFDRATAAGGQVLVERSESTVAAYAILNDIAGRPSVLLDAQLPRPITMRGALALRAASMSRLISAIVTLAALLVLLQRVVVGPLADLTAHAQSIAQSGDLTSRINSQRTDEIGKLAHAFDTMIERLAGYRAELIESSRRAGMADIASGVLHNVGNALNSVNVTVSTLEDRTRKSRVTGVQRAADLLASQGERLPEFFAADERGRQLPGYLSQLAGSLCAEQTTVLQDLDSLEHSLRHINEIIQAQQCFARGGSDVRELIRPDELLDSTLALAQASLARHNIAVAREFDDVPPISTDRVKVTQILMNLVTNAKDACAAGPPEDRRILVRLRGPADGRVTIEIVDNGQGIEPENMTRIFTSGFSTKRTGHGIGLHFCALAAHDLGGNLTAASDGPGKGARFILELPAGSPMRSPA